MSEKYINQIAKDVYRVDKKGSVEFYDDDADMANIRARFLRRDLLNDVVNCSEREMDRMDLKLLRKKTYIDYWGQEKEC